MTKRSVLPFVGYYVTLAALVIGATLPEQRLWGVNWWGYYSLCVVLVLAGAGAVAPMILRLFERRRDLLPKGGSPGGGMRYWLPVAGLIALFGLVFYLLRAKTHFLGDGYLVLSNLASATPFVKSTEWGGTALNILLKGLIGGNPERAALLSFQGTSIGAGVLFVLVAAAFTRVLFERTPHRILFLLGICTGGYMLLFFGYVEYYSLFVLSVLVFTLTGLLVARGEANRWLMLPLLALAVFFHILGVTLIPAAVYLLMIRTRAGRAIARMKRISRMAVASAAVVVLLAVFHHFYTSDLFFRFAFVPFLSNRFSVDGYTLFSMTHLADILNLMILLLPGLLVMVALPPAFSLGAVVRKVEYRYLLLLTLSVWGAVFVLDPKLGMPRDWDLFSFAGVPLGILTSYFLLDNRRAIKPYVTLSLLCVVAGLLTLIPRAVSQTQRDIAIAHFECYTALDRTKNINARRVLFDYYSARGEQARADEEMSRWQEDYPERFLFGTARDHRLSGRIEEAIRVMRQLLEVNPLYSIGWADLGEYYARVGMLDSALLCVQIADGLNPHSAPTLANVGLVYMQRNDLDRAEEAWLEAAALDTSLSQPRNGLMWLYHARGDEARYFEYLRDIASRDDAPPPIIRELGDNLLSRGRYQQALSVYRHAIRRGLDSAQVRRLIEAHPELESEIP